METIYAKMTTERAEEFRQMTKICIENDNKFIVKEPLGIMAEMHIQNMFMHYSVFRNNKIDILCPIEKYNKGIKLEYLKGESLCDELLSCVDKNDKETFIQLLLEYKDFVIKNSCGTILFDNSTSFRNIFGDFAFDGKKCARISNIDLIFENLIRSDKSFKVIDYEWIFDFAVPYEFIFFRAINSFFIKHSKVLENFIKINSIYDIFDIHSESIEIYQNMDMNFLSYVYGENYNYDEILKKYRKKAFKVDTKDEEQVLKTQLYYDTGNGFNEKECICLDVPLKERFELVYEIPEKSTKLRFDPSNNAINLLINNVTIINHNNEIKKIEYVSSNADVKIENYFNFYHDDPQIYINDSDNIKSITINFKIVDVLNDEITLLINKEKETAKNLKDLKRINNDLNKLKNIYLEMIKCLKKELINSYERK